jgi:glutamyl-tRNA reductase
MKIVLLGVSHKTAPVGLRERLAIAPADLAKTTRSLLMTAGVREALILSTCNRVELVTCQEDEGAELLNFIQDYFGVTQLRFVHMLTSIATNTPYAICFV